MKNNQNEQDFSDDKKERNAEIMLTLGKENFDNEEQRKNFLIAKAQTLSTVASISFAGFSVLSSGNIFLNLFPMILSAISIILGLYVLISQKYEWIAHSEIVDDKQLEQEPWAFQMRVAKTYIEASKKSKPTLDCAIKIFDIAVWFLISAFLVGTISFVNYRGSVVENNNGASNQSGGNMPNTTPSTPAPNTTPYTTETIKKSIPDTTSYPTTSIRESVRPKK